MRRVSLLLFVLMHSGFSYAVTSIEIQALFSNKVVALIDEKRRVLSVGKSSPEGVKLISANSKGARLEVDGVVKDFLLGNKISLSYSQPEMLEEKVFADEMGMFLQTGTINGFTVNFLIDTGATSIAMNKTHAKRLGIRYRIDGDVSSASTASGFVKTYQVKLKSVTLGSIKQSNVSAVVIDGNHPGPILLGMSFLSRLKVEKMGNVMTFTQRK